MNLLCDDTSMLWLLYSLVFPGRHMVWTAFPQIIPHHKMFAVLRAEERFGWGSTPFFDEATQFRELPHKNFVRALYEETCKYIDLRPYTDQLHSLKQDETIRLDQGTNVYRQNRKDFHVLLPYQFFGELQPMFWQPDHFIVPKMDEHRKRQLEQNPYLRDGDYDERYNFRLQIIPQNHPLFRIAQVFEKSMRVE